MKKIRLELDTLQVETFAASPERPARGTAVAHGTGLPYDSQCCATQYMDCTYDADCNTDGACGDDPVRTNTCNTGDCVTELCGDM